MIKQFRPATGTSRGLNWANKPKPKKKGRLNSTLKSEARRALRPKGLGMIRFRLW